MYGDVPNASSFALSGMTSRGRIVFQLVYYSYLPPVLRIYAILALLFSFICDS